MPPTASFTRQTFAFLRDLKANNERVWFQTHTATFETHVKGVMLAFITDLAPKLRTVNPYLVADPRPVGGSMFRIYRDTRFSKDKSPYKPWVSAWFRHEDGKDQAAPGAYLHIEPGNVFAGVGMWHPPNDAVAKIRATIVDDPAGWKRAFHGKAFRDVFEPEGDALKRPPRGFDADHPYVEDLKRKDFIGVTRFTQADALSPAFADDYIRRIKKAKPLLAFLARAVDVAW